MGDLSSEEDREGGRSGYRDTWVVRRSGKVGDLGRREIWAGRSGKVGDLGREHTWARGPSSSIITLGFPGFGAGANTSR